MSAFARRRYIPEELGALVMENSRGAVAAEEARPFRF